MLFVLLPALLFSVYHASTTSPEDTSTKPNDWEYDEMENNISHWEENFPECGSDRQSPIDIIIKDTTSESHPYQCNEDLLLQFTSQSEHFAIRNNGHSLQAIPIYIEHEGGSEMAGLEILHHTNDTAIRLMNSFYNTYKSSVNKEYCFSSLHFHWGETNEYGSEHALNGELYPLEVHLVHYSCDYRMAKDAQRAYSTGESGDKYDDDNVLAVIAVLFRIGSANTVLDKILDDFVVNAVRFYDSNMEYENMIELYYTEFDLMDLLPLNKEMIGYLGSLTTPPCYETVRWHIMKDTMTVSLEQMIKFRMILESTDLDDNMAPNWRPLQPIGDRLLYQCKESVDEEEVEKDEDNDVNATEGIIVDDYEEHDDEEHGIIGGVIHFEVDGNGSNVLWAIIGVAFIVICYLTYLIHCKSDKSGTQTGESHETDHLTVSDTEFMPSDEDGEFEEDV